MIKRKQKRFEYAETRRNLHTHTTKALLVFFLVFAIIPSFAQHPRITQLIAEKQAKMEKLEKCQGTTKKLKIAGISTLGVTAVGVGANIAEAVILKDKESKIATAKEELTKQQEQKEKREAEEKKKTECNSGTNTQYNEQAQQCECKDGYAKDENDNCVKQESGENHVGNADSDETSEDNPKEQNEEVAAPTEQADAFSTACKSAGYNPHDQKDNGNNVTEHSCFAYIAEPATQAIADKKFEIIKNSCGGNATIKKDTTGDYFVANCGTGTDGKPNRFYVKQRGGGTTDNALKQFEKACKDADADFNPTQLTSSGKDYIACIIGGNMSINAKPADMKKAMKEAVEKSQFKGKRCTGNIIKSPHLWYIDCKDNNDIRYVYKNLICEDNEVEENGECKPLNCDANEYEVAKDHKCEECKDDEKLENGKCVSLVCKGSDKGYTEVRDHKCHLKGDTYEVHDFDNVRGSSVRDVVEGQIKNWFTEHVGDLSNNYECVVKEATYLYNKKDVVRCTIKADGIKSYYDFYFENITGATEGIDWSAGPWYTMKQGPGEVVDTIGVGVASTMSEVKELFVGNEDKEFYKRFEKACIDSGFIYDVYKCYIGDENRDAKPADMENVLKAEGTKDQFKAMGCDVNTIYHMSYGYTIHCNKLSRIIYRYRNLICEDDEKVSEDWECRKK